MSDRDISKLYSESVSKRKFDTINSRFVNEDVEIIGIPAGQPEESLGEIPADYYNKLKRTILSKSVGGTEELFLQLLRLARWEQVPVIDDHVINISLNHDIDNSVLLQIIQKKKEGTLGSIENHLASDGIWSLENCLDPLVKKLTPTWKELFTEICNEVQPKINNVSVGRGEVGVSLFTNANKADKDEDGNQQSGDLYVNGSEIEVKGDSGRLGSSDYTKGITTAGAGGTGQTNRYLDILQSKGMHFADADTRRSIDVVSRTAELVAKYIDQSYMPGATKRGDIDINQLTAIRDIISRLNKESLQDREDIQLAYNTLSKMWRGFMMMSGVSTTIGIKKLNTWMNDVIQCLQKALVNASEINADTYKWQDTAQYMFNNDWSFTPAELAEAFVEMRTEPLDQAQVADLIAGVEQVFSRQDIRRDLFKGKEPGKGNVQSLGQRTLQRMQLALHATSYQSVHGFPYLLIINTEKHLDAISLKFTGDNLGDVYLSIFSQLEKHPRLIAGAAGVDSRNKGMGITLT